MSRRLVIILSIIGVLYLMSACTARKFIESNQYYLDEYEVVLETGVSGETKSIMYEELGIVLDQAPTKKTIFGSRPKAWYYHKYKNDSTGLKRWLFKRFAKKPTYLEDVPLPKYEQNLRRVMEIDGFYHANIETKIKSKKKKASITFNITSNEPTRIHSFITDFKIPDFKSIENDLLENTLLKKDAILNLTDLENERVRITDELHDLGYFYFSSDYLLFEVDTSNNSGGKAEIFLTIKDNTPADGLIKYKTGEIKVYSDFHLTDSADYISADEEDVEGIKMISKVKSLKSKVLRKSLHYQIEQVISHTNHQHSLTDLGNLGLYKFINAIPEQNMNDTAVDVTIYLTPEVRHSLKAEISLVSKSNNFTGPAISISHVNKNAFRGGEKFYKSVVFAYETQLGGARSGLNAYEIGMESHLDLPGHKLPILDLENPNLKKPFSSVSASYNFQKRVNQFALNSVNLSFYYDWHWKKEVAHRLGLFKLTYLKVGDLSVEYQQLIQTNPFLAASFSDNLLPEMDYEFTYRPQKKGHTPYYFYMHANLAGNVANGVFNAVKSTNNSDPNALFGVSITQFARLLLEGRKFIHLKKDQIAIRCIAGAGYAYGNSTSLPYQKQFFAGGSNSIRAFSSRLLGPGSVEPGNVSSSNSFLDQTGDMHLELNAEYRLKLNSIMELAGFVDAGNIWLLRDDVLRPGGLFKFDTFYEQIAVGTGIGTRFDFDFFLIRFDLAFPLHIPYKTTGSRWVVKNINPLKSTWRKNNLILNIGIGHPF